MNHHRAILLCALVFFIYVRNFKVVTWRSMVTTNSSFCACNFSFKKTFLVHLNFRFWFRKYLRPSLLFLLWLSFIHLAILAYKFHRFIDLNYLIELPIYCVTTYFSVVSKIIILKSQFRWVNLTILLNNIYELNIL